MTLVAPRVRPVVLAIAVLTAAAPACTNARDSDANTPQATATTQPPSTTRPSCEVAVPASWQEAIENSGVSTGGVSTAPRTVGPDGEVASVRDNGDTRDLLLIGADKSVTEIYAVPEPGVDRIPRGANGVLPTVIRIDVIDRQDGSVRTVVQQSEDAYGSGGPTLDTVALFGEKVYWTTRDTYAGNTGTLRSYDLGTGGVADVASGDMGDVRATAVGLTWAVEGRRGYPDVNWWEHAEVKFAAPLPRPVDEALGMGPDRLSLTIDGTAYAWITGVDRGGTGVAWWSPEAGLVRVTGGVVRVTDWLPPVYVVGPYVVTDKGLKGDIADRVTTVVDTRSGATTFLNNSVAGADGGTIAMCLRADPGKLAPSTAGVVRSDELPPLSC